MSLRWRRLLYYGALVAWMPLSGWAGTHSLWRWAFGDDVGTALAVFFDLQVESYATVLTFALVLDVVYGLHWGEGGWAWRTRGPRARAAAYVALLVLVGICAARDPLRSVLEVPLPHDVAASVAQYLRRALEGVIATVGLMVFLDAVRPGGLGRVPSSQAARLTRG